MRHRRRVSVVVLATMIAAGDAPIGCGAAAAPLREDFTTTPFDTAQPRWCERYHHGHWRSGEIRFFPSDESGCEAGLPGEHLSCEDEGCDACGCCTGSPCSKTGDPLRNAVIQTAADQLGVQRSVTATFAIERGLPVGDSHLGLYVALHPHCHTTVQALLVPDRPGEYHLNVAAFNQYIGGDRSLYESCREHPLAVISDPLSAGIPLAEGRLYRWTLRATLESPERIRTTSELRDADGAVLARGRYAVSGPGLDTWFGAPGGATRMGFGAQFSKAASPSGGSPSLRLVGFRAIAGPRAAP